MQHRRSHIRRTLTGALIAVIAIGITGLGLWLALGASSPASGRAPSAPETPLAPSPSPAQTTPNAAVQPPASPAASGVLAAAALERDLYEAIVTVDPDANTLTGALRLTYLNTSEDTLYAIKLHLYPNEAAPGCMQITGVAVDHTKSYFSLNEGASVLTIPLLSDLPPKGACEAFIRFTVAIPDMPGGFGVNRTGLMLGGVLPIAAVYEDGDWRTDAYQGIGAALYSRTSDYKVIVRYPASGYELAHTGRAAEDAVDGSTRTRYIVAPEVRAFALALVAKPKVTTLTTSDGKTSVIALVPNKYNSAFAAQTALAALEHFNTLVGRYPYPTLYIVPFGGDGDMAYPGLILVDSGCLYDAEHETGEFIVARAVAREWFGCVVGSDHIRAPWLDEALVEYLGFRFIEAYRGAEHSSSLWAERYGALQGYERKNAIDAPLSAFTKDDYFLEVNAYGAGMYRSLEGLMGREAFDEALTAYYYANSMRFAGYDELVFAFSEAHGALLTEWFEANR